jgi:hypothetical protein
MPWREAFYGGSLIFSLPEIHFKGPLQIQLRLRSMQYQSIPSTLTVQRLFHKEGQGEYVCASCGTKTQTALAILLIVPTRF